MENVFELILNECINHKEKNPVEIFNSVASKEFVRIHGPEHHILDGACILTAFYNAGGKINLEEGLKWMIEQGSRMPGASCANWGICLSSASIGAALSFIDKTNPLSSDGSWGNHMECTSQAIARTGIINGPRCCKRDGYIALDTAIDYINCHYDVKLEKTEIKCGFSKKNQQCIGNKCPYHS